MTTIAYIANEFPSSLEPYVIDEITELRRRGTKVICCSGKRVSPDRLSLAERAFWKETRFFQPLSDDELVRAVRRLLSDRHDLWQLATARCSGSAELPPARRIRALGHTVMGAALAEQLAPLEVEHIHAHHGYFASWMALAAAPSARNRLQFYAAWLRSAAARGSACGQAAGLRVLCHRLRFQPAIHSPPLPFTPPEKIVVQRLGVDRVLSWRPLHRQRGSRGERASETEAILSPLRGTAASA